MPKKACLHNLITIYYFHALDQGKFVCQGQGLRIFALGYSSSWHKLDRLNKAKENISYMLNVLI